MKIKLMAETTLDIDETKAFHKLLGEMTQSEYEKKGLTEEEQSFLNGMWDDLDENFGSH